MKKSVKSVIFAGILASALSFGMISNVTAGASHTTTYTYYDDNGYDLHGYNSHGYNVHGYNSHGYNVHGYNSHGYNIHGYSANGHYNGHYNDYH